MRRKKKEVPEQTDPPSIPVTDLFPSGEFPEGEIQQYKDEWVYVISTKSTQCNQVVIPTKLGFVYFYSTKYMPFLQFKESLAWFLLLKLGFYVYTRARAHIGWLWDHQLSLSQISFIINWNRYFMCLGFFCLSSRTWYLKLVLVCQ